MVPGGSHTVVTGKSSSCAYSVSGLCRMPDFFLYKSHLHLLSVFPSFLGGREALGTEARASRKVLSYISNPDYPTSSQSGTVVNACRQVHVPWTSPGQPSRKHSRHKVCNELPWQTTSPMRCQDVLLEELNSLYEYTTEDF